jgi:RNA 3'-terminal phosphate cyclase
MMLRYRTLALAASIVSISVVAHAQTMKAVTDPKTLDNVPDCVPGAPAGYPARQCLVTIDRQAPVTPPALLVSPGTHVFVRVTNTRPNELVLFAVGTTRVPPPDVAGAAVKSLITPLQSL